MHGGGHDRAIRAHARRNAHRSRGHTCGAGGRAGKGARAGADRRRPVGEADQVRPRVRRKRPDAVREGPPVCAWRFRLRGRRQHRRHEHRHPGVVPLRPGSRLRRQARPSDPSAGHAGDARRDRGPGARVSAGGAGRCAGRGHGGCHRHPDGGGPADWPAGTGGRDRGRDQARCRRDAQALRATEPRHQGIRRDIRNRRRAHVAGRAAPPPGAPVGAFGADHRRRRAQGHVAAAHRAVAGDAARHERPAGQPAAGAGIAGGTGRRRIGRAGGGCRQGPFWRGPRGEGGRAGAPAGRAAGAGRARRLPRLRDGRGGRRRLPGRARVHDRQSSGRAMERAPHVRPL